jgi:PIN domain nuclease of toxin-antitoxin system
LRYLLDTCVFIWLVNDQREHLSPKALDTLSLSGQEFAISVITLLEMSLKFSAGKLDMPGGDIGALLTICVRESIDILSLTPEHIQQLTKIPRAHHDPFDRLLAAVSVSHATDPYTVISPDISFDAYSHYGVKRIW